MRENLKSKAVSMAQDEGSTGGLPWINPIGGLGDTLMLSGVLKLVHQGNRQPCFNLVRRTRYQSILHGHPAIGACGSPPPGATIVGTDYWSKEPLGGGRQRAFQILARMFGLRTPVEETLFFPGRFDEPDLLDRYIPWSTRPVVLIAPSSESPRKIMHPAIWHQIVQHLLSEGVFVLQAGLSGDVHIRGAYSLLGLTNPRQIVSLAKKCRAIITVDNFIMHVAHLVGCPAVVLWGPTSAEVYGYPEQKHFQANLDGCNQRDACLGPSRAENYGTPCPLGREHCMDTLPIESIEEAAREILRQGSVVHQDNFTHKEMSQ